MHTTARQEINGRYKTLSNSKLSGATYTPHRLAQFVAEEILKKAANLSKTNIVRILDPAVGDGELLIALISELKTRGYNQIEATGFDTDTLAAETAKARITSLYPDVTTLISVGNFLELLAIETEMALDLFAKSPDPFLGTYDLVIANPPYVRTQLLGARQAFALADRFGLEGRVDLYHAFLLGLDRVLGKDSVVGIIVSNRFMTTRTGSAVRRGLWDKFSIHCIWDFGDTRLFDAAVLPAVLIFRPKQKKTEKFAQTSFVSIYSAQERTPIRRTTSIFESLTQPGSVTIDSTNFEVRIGHLQFGDDPGNVWRIENASSSEWLDTVTRNTYCKFRDVGKIRVGIKTTADNVFIRCDWDQIPENNKPELLKPLTTHRIARRFKATTDVTAAVLYPHEVRGGRRISVDLDEFPKSKCYLEKHRSQLEGRKYVIEAGRRWYEIWVPQDPRAGAGRLDK